MIRLLRKTYTNRRDMEIEIFFKYVNWYKLIARSWDLYPTYSAASEKIFELKRRTKEIKKMWHDNPSLTLPQVLAVMDLLPIRNINKRKGGNAEWYFSTVDDMMTAMGIPEREFFAWCSVYNVFNFKRKYPKCVLVKDMSSWHLTRILKHEQINAKNKKKILAELESRKGLRKWF